jgi:AraC-like DNA-binding protein
LLTARLGRRSADPAPEVTRAWRRLRSSHGSARISELAGESGLSHRAFAGRFRRQVGVAPKTAARIVRYERATALLEAGTRSVAEVAALSGYADQAHLDREFAALAGRSPTRLVQERAGSEYQSIRSVLFKTGQR